MILAKLASSQAYAALHPGFSSGFDFLQRPDISQLEDGKIAIDGDRLFAIIARGMGRGMDESPLEFHRRYIDIQYVVSGAEMIGWSPLADCRAIRSKYDEATDIGFFSDHPTTWCAVPADCCAIFYPEDAHAPLAGTSPVHKVVVKVAMDRELWH